MTTDQSQRKRAVAYVQRRMAARSWDRARLVMESGLDPKTVRTFLAGETWPQSPKRRRIEDALGLPAGMLEAVAAGAVDADEEPEGDAVELAIRQSALNRANQHTLIGTYYGMLDEQERGTA